MTEYPERLTKFYERNNERDRLSSTATHEIERRTTLEYLNRIVSPGDRVLDGCAGAGAYCFDIASWGCSVVAGDIVARNIHFLRQDSRAKDLESTYVGDLCNLDHFEDCSFDTILSLGAYYHIQEQKARTQMLRECVRLVRPGGKVAVAYLNRHACFTLNFSDHPDQLDRIIEQFHSRVKRVFFRSTPQEITQNCLEVGLSATHNIALDGYARIYNSQLEQLSEADFNRYYEWHLENCEDPSTLGSSVHGLYIGRKAPLSQ